MWVPVAVWQPFELLYTCYLCNCRVCVHLSVCQSTGATTCGGFAAELGRGQQILIDSCRRSVPAHTHTHTFNVLEKSRTTWVSQYQKDKTNLDFTEARDSEWQWHQLDHMQVCTSLQTDNHASTPPLSFFTGRMPFLPPNQQCTCNRSISATAAAGSVMLWAEAQYRVVAVAVSARVRRFRGSVLLAVCRSCWATTTPTACDASCQRYGWFVICTYRLAQETVQCSRERKCADTIGTVLVPWASHFQC